jgi:hypothetical protein
MRQADNEACNTFDAPEWPLPVISGAPFIYGKRTIQLSSMSPTETIGQRGLPPET